MILDVTERELIDGTRILTCAPLCCAADCASCATAARKWAAIAREQSAAINMVLRRLFHVLRPNFLSVGPLEWLPPRIPRDARGIFKGRKHPSGNLRAGHLSSRKVYMGSMKKLVTRCAEQWLLAAGGLPWPQEPQGARGEAIKTQVSL